MCPNEVLCYGVSWYQHSNKYKSDMSNVNSHSSKIIPVNHQRNTNKESYKSCHVKSDICPIPATASNLIKMFSKFWIYNNTSKETSEKDSNFTTRQANYQTTAYRYHKTKQRLGWCQIRYLRSGSLRGKRSW